MRVLVVDDDPDECMTLAVLLQAHGFETATAQDGGSAFVELCQFRPDVVLLDLMMPRINGWEFLDSKAVSSLFQNVPVIVLSGWANIDQEIPKNAGITSVMMKGVDSDELVREIHRVTGNKRGVHEQRQPKSVPEA